MIGTSPFEVGTCASFIRIRNSAIGSRDTDVREDDFLVGKGNSIAENRTNGTVIVDSEPVIR